MKRILYRNYHKMLALLILSSGSWQPQRYYRSQDLLENLLYLNCYVCIPGRHDTLLRGLLKLNWDNQSKQRIVKIWHWVVEHTEENILKETYWGRKHTEENILKETYWKHIEGNILKKKHIEGNILKKKTYWRKHIETENWNTFQKQRVTYWRL